MITFTKEQLIASAHARIEFAEMMLAGELEPLKERTWSIELDLARIALASLEAEGSERNPVLAYADSYRDMANQGVESIPVWCVITDLERNIAPLFTAPPAQVVPDEKPMPNPLKMYAVDAVAAIAEVRGWNACRAAMLQGAEHVTTANKLPEGYVLVPVEPTVEMIAEAKRWTGLTSTAEVVYSKMIAAAPQQEVK